MRIHVEAAARACDLSPARSSLVLGALLGCLILVACGSGSEDGPASGTAGARGPSPAGVGGRVEAGVAGAAGRVQGAGGAGSVAAAGSAGSDRAVAGVGGSTGAGGSPAAGGAAAGASAAALPCASDAFCDSFDSGGTALDPARWGVVSPNCSGEGVAELDLSTAYTGRSSLRVRGGAGYCNHVFATPVPALPNVNPLYGRMYVRFERALTGAHVTFAALRDAGEGKDLRMGGQSEILMWNRESDDATLPELSPAGIALSVKPAVNEWLCIEFMLDREQRRLATWVDGEAVPGLQVEGEPTPDVDSQWLRKVDWTPMPADLKLGWESYGNDANTLWFDDIALGGQRFGC